MSTNETGIVQREYERIRARVWDDDEADDRDEVLGLLSPAERAIYVTRELEAELADGGWYLVFANSDEQLIELALDAYGLLGLPRYVAHLQEVVDSDFGDASPEADGDRLDNRYRRLRGAERARERLLEGTLQPA